MRKAFAVTAATLMSAGAAWVVGTPSDGSSHREAPLTSKDPTADDTDVYAFTAAEAPGSLTVVANWLPFEDPGGGPNFYEFDPKARYYVNIDNTGDGDYDVRFRYTFKTQLPATAGKGYPHSLPTVTDINDPGYSRQKMTVVRETYNAKRKKTGTKVLGANIPVAPSNVGKKTMPDYEALAAQAIKPLQGGGRIYAGQRDDAFFIPLDRVFDGLNLEGAGTGNEGGGIDTVAGYGVQSVIMQVPEAQVTRGGKAVESATSNNATVGVWASTDRRVLRVLRRGKGKRRKTIVKRRFQQVSRLGNPLINELVVPLKFKDKFNRTQPSGDLKNFGKFVLAPFPAFALNALFDLGIKETGRTDVVQALLTGVPDLNQISDNPAAADTLKINLGVPPTAPAEENRFGVIGGDVAGFPNGRRLADDVVDIELRVIGGFLLPEDQGGKKLGLGDGVDANDQPFSTEFPYVPSLKNEIGGSPTEDNQTPQHPPTSAENPK
ncbi:MAG: DUF4331 domain-containing protein [Solirubrobacteraceae bacterium]